MVQVQVYTEAQVQEWLAQAKAVACYTEAHTEARLQAIARVQRLEADIVLEADVYGLQDWADELGWA